MSPKRLAYYVTPHGFGHGVRSAAVMAALLERHPDLRLTVVTDLPDFLFEGLPGGLPAIRRKRLDVGLVQRDSLRHDLPATLAALSDLFKRFNALVDEETAFFADQGVTGLVSDVAFLPFAAAKRAKLPSVGVGNFTWDWIYQSYGTQYPDFFPFVFRIRNEYAKCGRFLRLPMHGDCSVFPVIEDVPLTARIPTRPAAAIRNLLGLVPGQTACLAAFSDLSLTPEAGRRLEESSDVVVFYKKPLRLDFANARCLDDLDLPYQDVVAAMDAVLTKPGYGVVSDCLASGAPMIHCERDPFPEYEILLREIENRLSAVFLPAADLLAGNWSEALTALARQERRPPAPADGAAVCAERIARAMGWE